MGLLNLHRTYLILFIVQLKDCNFWASADVKPRKNYLVHAMPWQYMFAQVNNDSMVLGYLTQFWKKMKFLGVLKIIRHSKYMMCQKNAGHLISKVCKEKMSHQLP